MSIHGAPLPAAKEILDSVRLQQGRQQIDLQGQLRENEKIISFRLTQNGPVIRYAFSNPDEALQLRLGENDSRLEEVTRSGVEKIVPAQFDRKVRGTGVSYEDLALKFLYWPNARVTGRRFHPHAHLLEAGIESAVASVAIFECISVGG